MIGRAFPATNATAMLLLFVLTLSVARVAAQSTPEAADAKPTADAGLDGVTAETLVGGLAAPNALALRPASSNSGPDLFISDRGSGKIVAIHSRDGGDLVDVVTGFAPGEAPLQRPGTLLGLLFLNRSTLLAVTEGESQEEQLVPQFNVKDGDWPLDAKQATGTSRLALPPDQALPDALRAAGMARNVGDLFVTTAGGQLFRAAIQGSELKPFSKFGDLAESTGSTRPGGITFSDKGYLVVALAGTAEEAGDSLIAFCHPYEENAKPLLVLKTGLNDIVALAYSPKTGNLYAADYSESETAEGGVYRIDAHRDEETKKMGAKAVLVSKVARPTALAFAGDGSLLVAASETSDDDSEAKGVVIKLTGDL